MNWLRNNDPNPADVDDPTARGWRIRLPCPAESVSGGPKWLRIQ
jgi:hypothetical protein